MNKGIIFVCMLLLCLACNDSDAGNTLPLSFQTIQMENNSNFVTLTAITDEDAKDASFEWSIPSKNLRLTGRSVVCYFEQKGTYEVTLTSEWNSQKGSITKSITVENDSYYYQQGEHLWWNDEFTSHTLDKMAWNYDIGTEGWGNSEKQNYTSSSENSFIRDGKLVIRALKLDGKTGEEKGDFTSARIITKGKIEINRGRVEVRAKVPGVKGTVPAIWFYGKNAYPYYSELDMMEYVAYEKNKIHGTAHTTATLADPKEETNVSSGTIMVNDVETSFHIYGMNWTDEKVEFYVDDPSNVYLSFTPSQKDNPRFWPFNSELYLIMNVSVGGTWGSRYGIDLDKFPLEMEIDYVRIFKKN